MCVLWQRAFWYGSRRWVARGLPMQQQPDCPAKTEEVWISSVKLTLSTPWPYFNRSPNWLFYQILILCLLGCWSIWKQQNLKELSDSLCLYGLQSGTHWYNSWASHPKRDVTGKWRLCEYCQLPGHTYIIQVLCVLLSLPLCLYLANICITSLPIFQLCCDSTTHPFHSEKISDIWLNKRNQSCRTIGRPAHLWRLQ